MAGDGSVAYWFGTNYTHSIVYGTNVDAGTPFWDPLADGITKYNGNWYSANQTMTNGYHLLNFTITYTNVTTNTYIDKIQFRSATDNSLVAEYGTDITAGSSTTITTATWGALSDVDMNFKIRIFLVGNGTFTPTITAIYGYYELSNTAPTISNCPSNNIIIRIGQQVTYSMTVSDPDVGDTHVWSIISGDAWLTINSATGQLAGTTYIKGNYPFTIQVSDGTATDTCGLTVDVLENYDQGKQPNLTYEWDCHQTAWNKLECWVNEWGLIPFENLNFNWTIAGRLYYGRTITHIFTDGFDLGELETVKLRVSTKDYITFKDEEKTFSGSNFPIMWFYIILAIMLLLIIFYIAGKRSKKKRRR